MSNLFSQVLNMSMTGSVVILLVMLARFLLKRAPKIFSYALWSVVLFRLLCPVAFTAPVSVLKVAEPAVQEAGNNISVVSYIPASIDTQADFIAVQPENLSSNQVEGSEPKEQLRMTPMHAVALIWVAGTVGMILYSVAQYLILRRKLVGSMQLQDNIYLTDYIDTAFVVGVFQPRIFLPSNVPSKERCYILAHEQHHIRRFDHVIKLLAYLALCIHWFNPLVWIAFVLAGKDMEMSCDEAVIKKLGAEIRADYSASLLRLATHKKILSGMPLAFGEGDTKSRVLNMARWKKPTKWIVVICVILCLCILAVCVVNPEKKVEQSISDITRHTYNGLTNISIGDLCFDYPAGLTSEQRDVDNWNEEDTLRSLRDLPHRRPFDYFFIDNETDFGGVVDFMVPDDRKINLEEMNLPYEWVGLNYIAGSSSYPYAEMEYTLIKDGKDYIQMYLYTYSGRGYFLWFYTEQGNPAHKQAILESVELGSFHKRVTKLKHDEIVSLGQFNITIPKGYGYFRSENSTLEITKQDLFKKEMILASVKAIPNPNLPMESEEDLTRWIEDVGIDLEGDSLPYSIDTAPVHGQLSLRRYEEQKGKTVQDHTHYFYIVGNTVYDLRIDQLHIDVKAEEAIMQSIWIKQIAVVTNDNNSESAMKESLSTVNAGNIITDLELVQYGSLEMVLFPGFSSREQDDELVLMKDSTDVGGIICWNEPGFKPSDLIDLIKEEYSVPIGYMSSSSIYGDMEIEVFQDGNPEALNQMHIFFYDDTGIYDVWYDQNQISYTEAERFLNTVQLDAPAVTQTLFPEEIAYEKCSAIIKAVQNSSYWLSCVRSDEGRAVLSKGTTIDYLRNKENWLTIQTQPEGGDNGTTVYKKAGYLHYNGINYNNELVDGIFGAMDEHGNVRWAKSTATEVYIPWLASFGWTEDTVSYMDTLKDETGECIMYRVDQKYFDGNSQTEHYFVNFNFDLEGNFIHVEIQVNPFQDNEFTETEAIVSLDASSVNAKIQEEYQRIAG